MNPCKPKPCSECREVFQPRNSLTKVCSYQCALKRVEAANTRKATQLAKKEESLRKRDLRARKVAIKPLSHWLGLTQTACNAYIRRRDENDGCISCNKPSTWGGQWHASHYRPAGNCSPLRFHPMNIHKACSECNNFKSGNLSEFRIKLIGKIGLDMVEFLESQNHPYKWDIDDANDVKAHYKEQFKLLKKVKK